MLAAGACSHAAPTRASTVECRSSAKAEIAGVDGNGACALVRERTLAAIRGRMPFAEIRIELDLSRRGSAVARVHKVEPAGIRALPEIAVDVMDRPLGRADLEQLADLIAVTLAQDSQS